jgi:glucose-6-phosphate 1-epimerase
VSGFSKKIPRLTPQTPAALEPTEAIKAIYEKPFHLTYVVTLAKFQLSTDISVKNTSSVEPLEFQTLFHNYFRVPSREVLVAPLYGTSYYDKTHTLEGEFSKLRTETRTAVDVRTYTDFVYDDPPAVYELSWPGGNVKIETKALKNVVIWNPREDLGSKISDMEDGGW